MLINVYTARQCHNSEDHNADVSTSTALILFLVSVMDISILAHCSCTQC